MNQTEGQMLLDLLKRKGKKISPILKKLDIDPATFYRHVKKPSMPEYMLEMIENEIGYKLKENETKPTTKKDTGVNEDKAEYGDPDTDIMVAFAGRVAIYIAKTRELSVMVAEHEVRFDKMFDIIADLRRADERQEKAIEELKKVHHG